MPKYFFKLQAQGQNRTVAALRKRLQRYSRLSMLLPSRMDAEGCPHYSTDHLPPFGDNVHFGSGVMRHSPCGTIRAVFQVAGEWDMEAALTMRLRQATETLKVPEKTIEYEVVGLPPGHEARIALFDDRWKIIHSDSGTRGEWVGPYQTAAAALAALQDALEED